MRDKIISYSNKLCSCLAVSSFTDILYLSFCADNKDSFYIFAVYFCVITIALGLTLSIIVCVLEDI